MRLSGRSDSRIALLVMAFVAECIAPHKKVRVVEFINALLKSASGKILRTDLRARAG